MPAIDTSKTEEPGKILRRTMFIDNTNSQDIRILPWMLVEYVGIGHLWEMRDVPLEHGPARRSANAARAHKKVTDIQFISERKLYSRLAPGGYHGGEGAGHAQRGLI